MKKLRLLSLVGITSIALANAGWAAGHGGGGGGFGGGGFGGGGGGHFGGGGGGGHFGGGVGSRGGGVGFGRPGFSGRSGYYYSRGMHFTNSRAGQFRSSVHRSSSVARSNRGMTNSVARQSRTTARNEFNRRMMGHISERHDANWHSDWDRRHAHFFRNRFFVFDDGFWFGLDPGFFPWDYYPYYAYDYYPYDYYPGYYADSEPYYYDNGVYSDTPMRDQTVNAVQTQLKQQGYYNGPVDGIFGRQTRDAVAKYQIDKKLDVTGTLSAQTLQSFGLPQPAAS